MDVALLRVLTIGLLAALALLFASPLTRAEGNPPAGDPPVAEDPAPADESGEAAADDGSAGAEEAEGGDDGEEAKAAPRSGALRRRPRTAEEERAWKETNAPLDPFLYTPGPLGPAPGVPEFYNPQDYISPEVSCGLSRYMIQDATGQVVGYLTFVLSQESHPEFGPVIAASLFYDIEEPYELKLWLDPLTLQPKRMQKQQRLVPGAAIAQAAAGAGEATAGDESQAAAQIASLQRIPQDRVDYVFDSVRLWHSGGGVTVSRTFRQLPFSYELASLPVLVRQVQPYGQDWPFEAALVDALKVRNLPLRLAEPVMADVLSAEPVMHQCYELHLTIGDEEQVYWVERSRPRRLIKFMVGGHTYNLFEYTEGG